MYEYSESMGCGPTAIAIDSENAIIYWNQYQNASTSNDVWRSTLNTFAKEKWVNTISYPYTYSISLDTTNKKFYLTANSYWDVNSVFGSGNTGAVCFGNLEDGTYSTPVNETGPADPSIPLRGVAVDGSKGYTYYANNSTIPVIVRAELTL